MGTSSARARGYDSPLRQAKAARTRAAIMAAARESFEARGWQGTTMRGIATAAGVAVETVYAMVGSKAAILARLVDIAIVGDDEDVPLRERAVFLRLGKGSRAARARAAAELLWDVNSRIGGLERAVRQGAAVDETCAATQVEIRTNQRRGVREGLTMLGVQPTEEQVIGVLAATCSEVFLLLTRELGVDRETYLTWLTNTIVDHLARGARTAPRQSEEEQT